ncbi:hypothetical protein [Parahaliea mediterranea]|uniref:Lipoprotein n=1 Tax=Parahaliea mediterranea TaxID=651086 RepID=A0A939DFI6_9GAMM|nr:hypothetical protein [Parahaliea mediterranea]MBN7796946.1 hypothetical protein [Parahaliea mediterranea]
MDIKQLVSALLMAGLLSACGSGSSSGSGSDSPPVDKPVHPPPELSGDEPLPPANGDLLDIAIAPPAADVRVGFELAEAYQSQVTDLAVNGDGLWCHVQRLTGQDGPRLHTTRDWQPGWAQSLRCHVDAQEVFSYRPDPGAVIVDMAMQDSSRVLLLEAIPSDFTGGSPVDGNWFELRLTQLDGAGNALQRRWLEDVPAANELFYYSYEPNSDEPTRTVAEDLSHNGRPQLSVNQLARLQVHEGVPFLLAHTYGVKVYRFHDDLTVAWDRQVMPAYRWLWSGELTNTSRMAIRDDGAVAVAFELFDDDVAIYSAHFEQPLEDVNEGSDVGVAVIAGNGAPLGIFMAGLRGHSESLEGMFWRSGDLLLTGSTRYEKAGAAGGTTEWDSYLAWIDGDSGETTHSQLYHVHDEDMVRDAVLTDGGRLLLAGESGYRQADTHSQVSYGYGVIYEVTDTGEVLPLMKLDTPRNSTVNGIQVVGDTLYYRYDFDGFITHTCDQDQSLCWIKSGVSNMALDELGR